jgi:hypothetical protein
MSESTNQNPASFLLFRFLPQGQHEDRKMKTFLKKLAACIGTAALATAMTACASHKATADQDYGQIRTEQTAQQSNTSSDQVVGTAPAPSNAAGVASSSTPAAISGPAKVDDSGRAYTSSSVGSAGNGSGIGTNTNVNLIPQQSKSSVTVTQSPATVDTTVATNTTSVESTTTVPAPAPVVTTPTTTVTETTTTTESVPMTSSTTVDTTTPTTTTETTATTQESTSSTTTHSTSRHRRMRKD